MSEEKTELFPAVDGATPLAAYAQVAHEMFMEMQAAGFEPEDALTMTMNLLPEWTFPIPTEEWEEEDEEFDEDEDED